MPTCPVTDQHGVGCGADTSADLGKVDRHGFTTDPRHDDRSAHSSVRADRPEQVGGLVAVVADRRRAGTNRRPYIGQCTLLSNTGLVLEPDLDRFSCGLWREDVGYPGSEVFLKASCASASFFG